MKRYRICMAIIIFISLSIHGIGQTNIPSSTKNAPTALDTISGLAIGEYNPSFNPFHAWGPDKDTRICMACNYGRYHGIMYFVGNHPNWSDIKLWLTYLEKESNARNKYLKVYFIYANETDYAAATREKELEDLGKELHIQQVALTYVPSLTDKESEVNQNQINPSIENNIILSLDGVIIQKYLNLKPTEENFKMLTKTMDSTAREEFNLIPPVH